MRGATEKLRGQNEQLRISIHAPHAGRDCPALYSSMVIRNFNPRAPCGARPVRAHHGIMAVGFQSTRPMRGATTGRVCAIVRYTFQSTRPMRGATDAGIVLPIRCEDFNPRAPCGARPWSVSTSSSAGNFNPRAPCGARQWVDNIVAFCEEFQSTRPMRGATRTRKGTSMVWLVFQSTRPMRGATCFRTSSFPSIWDFNPRAPCGARRCGFQGAGFDFTISIHAPHAGRDDFC